MPTSRIFVRKLLKFTLQVIAMLVTFKVSALDTGHWIPHTANRTPVMSEYKKMDTNKYWNILGSHNMYRLNIRIYLDPTYLPKIYLNIFVLRKYHEYK